MQYMLLFHQPATELERTPDDSASADYWESWRAYMSAIYEAGIVTSGQVLQPPSTAATVRFRDGQREVLDGPFAETKEMLGGYVRWTQCQAQLSSQFSVRCLPTPY